LLEKDPKKRIGSQQGFEEIKEHPWLKGMDWNSLSQKMVLN